MKRFVVAAMLLAGACAAPAPRPTPAWHRTDDRAEPFEQARAACRTYAMERSSRSQNQSIAAKAAAGAFAECMRQRGWALTDQD